MNVRVVVVPAGEGLGPAEVVLVPGMEDVSAPAFPEGDEVLDLPSVERGATKPRRVRRWSRFGLMGMVMASDLLRFRRAAVPPGEEVKLMGGLVNEGFRVDLHAGRGGLMPRFGQVLGGLDDDGESGDAWW